MACNEHELLSAKEYDIPDTCNCRIPVNHKSGCTFGHRSDNKKCSCPLDLSKLCPHVVAAGMLTDRHGLTMDQLRRMYLVEFPNDYHESYPPLQPTKHRPGTWDKILVMRERVKRGEAACSPLDAPLNPPEVPHAESA